MHKIAFGIVLVAGFAVAAGFEALMFGRPAAISPCADPRAATVCTDDDFRCQLLNPKARVITACQVGEWPHFRWVDCDSLGTGAPGTTQKRVQHGVQR